ncbi:MAG: hypothetical protein ACI4IJ_02925 [Acutalibacteraceae bacterium]
MDKENEKLVGDKINQAMDSGNNQPFGESEGFFEKSEPAAEQLELGNVSAEKHESTPVPSVKKKKKSAKGKLILVLILLLILLIFVVSGAAFTFYSNFAVIGDIFGSYKIYNCNVTEADLSGSDIEDFSGLARLNKLETIDLTNTSVNDLSVLYNCKSLKSVTLLGKDISAEKCIEFYEALPDTQLKCNVVIGKNKYDSSLTEFKPNGIMDYDITMIAALRRLQSLDLIDYDVSNEKYDYLHEKLPDCMIKRNVTIFDMTVESTITDIDLRRYKYSFDEFKAEFEKNLKYLPNLKKVDMCYCGLSNEEMEELGNTYPDIKFVWIIKFGRWKVRTDAVIFSALNSNGLEFYDENTYAPLFKYCHDLVALDLGHGLIADVSGVANLKKLRAVIFTDNKITDISAFAELKDLEFMEMNVNRIKSVEPLKDLNNLKYINLWSSKSAKDLSYLYNHESLELVIFHRSVSRDERQRFRDSNPNCRAYFAVPTDTITTNKDWRENPYRIELKKAFTNWRYVVGFNEETGEYIFDWNTDQYKVISR